MVVVPPVEGTRDFVAVLIAGNVAPASHVPAVDRDPQEPRVGRDPLRAAPAGRRLGDRCRRRGEHQTERKQDACEERGYATVTFTNNRRHYFSSVLGERHSAHLSEARYGYIRWPINTHTTLCIYRPAHSSHMVKFGQVNKMTVAFRIYHTCIILSKFYLRIRLFRPSFAQNNSDGFEQNAYIEPETPVLRVVEFELDTFFKAEF